MKKETPLYFDYAATTPVDARVIGAMRPYLDGEGASLFGNPNSLHSFGQRAINALDVSRATLAQCIAAHYKELIFTSGATEANNIIIRATLKEFLKKNKGRGIIPKIITSVIEHPSIMETVSDIERDASAQVVRIPVDSRGVIDLGALKKHLDERTILVSVMWVNNETGVIQPIKEIVSVVEAFRSTMPKNNVYPLVHTDATQAFLLYDVNVISSGVDCMTLSAHKIYGPKGVGALYVRDTSIIAPFITGGGQEYGIRSGTENVPGIVGFARAAELVCLERTSEHKRLLNFCEYFFQSLKKSLPKVEKSVDCWSAHSPHILNVFVPYKDDAHIVLDLAGVCVSSGSACAQRFAKPSYVLHAMGHDAYRIAHSIRFSFGRFTTLQACDRALTIINSVLST